MIDILFLPPQIRTFLINYLAVCEDTDRRKTSAVAAGVFYVEERSRICLKEKTYEISQ
jgi:hypothetical protein